MKEIKITSYMKYIADKKARMQGILKHSFEKGEGNFAGYLGEEIVKRFLGVRSDNNYNHDIIYDMKTIDIKTKRCTSIPKPEYECSIPAYNVNTQNPDIYIFTRVMIKPKTAVRGWILGWMPKEEYMKKSVYIEKGTVDKSNYLVFPVSCYNIAIKDLYDINDLKEGT